MIAKCRVCKGPMLTTIDEDKSVRRDQEPHLMTTCLHCGRRASEDACPLTPQALPHEGRHFGPRR